MKNLASKIKAIDFKPVGLVEKLSEAMTEAILEGVFKEETFSGKTSLIRTMQRGKGSFRPAIPCRFQV